MELFEGKTLVQIGAFILFWFIFIGAFYADYKGELFLRYRRVRTKYLHKVVK